MKYDDLRLRFLLLVTPFLYYIPSLNVCPVGAGAAVRHLVPGREEPGGEGGAHGHRRGHHQVRGHRRLI